MKHERQTLKEKYEDFKWNLYVGKYDEQISYMLFVMMATTATIIIIKYGG